MNTIRKKRTPPPEPKEKPRKKTAVRYWLFRLFSNRGTDINRCFALPASLTAKEVREIMEQRADEETHGTACYEFSVQWRQVKVPAKPTLQARWEAACDAYDKASKRRNELRAMLSIVDLTGRY
jgi:hypothetical protein